jgi:hypothetical protein
MAIADQGLHHAVLSASDAFDVGSVATIAPLTGGHIHGSWLVTPHDGRRVVLQRINRNVFVDLDACEDTLDRVIRRVAVNDGHGVRVPVHLRTRAGAIHHVATDGDAWRAAWFAEHTHSLLRAPSSETACAAARLFGRYDRSLSTLPGGLGHPTIARFHDLAFRREQLESAVERDVLGRADACRDEIEAARRAVSDLLASLEGIGQLPERPTHGDAKIGNLRFSDVSGKPTVVLDLDTTMMAPILVDLGELLRSGSTEAREDGTLGPSVTVDPDRVAAIVKGFVDGIGGLLTSVERQSLCFAGPRMSIFNGIRFLADHLSGDTYYAIERPDQNLDRARTQLAVARQLSDQADVVAAIVS